MNRLKKCLSLVLAICMIISSATAVYAADDKIETVLEKTADYILKTVSDPQIGSIGGEWAIIGLARSGVSIPQEYLDKYYDNVVSFIKENNGVLHNKKYTEYSRVVLALTAIGKDPRDVAGYNLLEKLGDYEKTIWQGINGPIWALIALDSNNYEIPVNKEAKTQATREMYINEILNSQLSDGGFSLSSATSDADMTGMAVQALSKYQDDAKVKAAIDRAIKCLSDMQNADGGFENDSVGSSESTVQVITALSALGMDLEDATFVKNGHTLVDNLLSYYVKDNGFKHTYSESSTNLMATEQALYAMAAINRLENGLNSLYDMTDVVVTNDSESGSVNVGLPNKSESVNIKPVINAGKTFTDIKNHTNQKAIEELAARGIINGMTADSFAPDKTMTRAEFATIVTRALGLETVKVDKTFKDVKTTSWYYSYVMTAYSYGIVNGRTADTFDPLSTITKQEASAMVARAAKLCGMDTEMTDTETRDMLAQFGDYMKVSTWARPTMAFCYKSDILSQDDFEINPKVNVKRCEIAQMIYNLLNKSELL